MPELGQPAPAFSLKSNLDKDISLADYQGKKNVVLTFYPLDFSPVCSIQLPEYSSHKADFDRLDAEVLGVNRDSVYTHKAWAKEFGIDVPLLADLNGATAKAYGVYLEDAGISKRAVFVIDKKGILRAQHVESAPGEFTYHAEDILKALSEIQG